MIQTGLAWNAAMATSGLKLIQEVVNDQLACLKNLLDRYNGYVRPLAYYDVLAGDWLFHFTHQVYVAWKEVQAGNIPANAQPIPIASHLAQYGELQIQGKLHEYLRWAVASLLNGNSPETWVFEAETALITSGGRKQPQDYLRNLVTAKPNILITNPYVKCSRPEWLSALWRWRHKFAWDNIQYPIKIVADVDVEWRRQRAIEGGIVPTLAGLLRVLLPLQIPVALLEGFADYRNAVLAFPVPRPKAAYSANGLHGHMAWKLLLAEWRQQGTLLLYHQHGGGYGLDRIHAVEDYEIRVADRFYTWGWRRGESHVKPLCAPPPNGLQRSKKWIMLSCVNFPNVAIRLHFHPMPGKIQDMHRETYNFLAALPDRANLLVRPYPQDYGWDFTGKMRQIAPDATFDDGKATSFRRFAESRLVVHNYLGTAWLETLALDVPTVCFFDPETYAFREAAQPYVDGLERVGVLHRSGHSAARFVAALGNDVQGWWQKCEVQAARRDFIERYAHFSMDWKRRWELEFEEVLASAQ